jgi:putative tricarboxylic transport membrane protein
MTRQILARLRGPFWVGLGMTAFGTIWFYEGIGLQEGGRYSGVSAGTFVVLIGAVLIILGVLTTIAVLGGAEFAAESTEDAADGPVSVRALVLTIFALAVPILTMEAAGFPVTIAAVFFIITKAFGSSRPILDVVVSVMTSAAIWFLLTGFGVNLGPAFPFLG